MKTQETRRTRTYLRVGIGLALVVSSLIASSVVLDSRGATRSVLVLRDDMAAGELVSSDAVDRFELIDDVALGPYLRAQELADVSELVLGRDVAAGEMLRSGDFVEPTLRNDSVISIPLNIGMPEWLKPGGVAQLWVAPPVGENAFSAPFVLSPEVVIDRIAQDDGFAADRVSSMADIRVRMRDLPGVIHALANGYFVHLAPIPPTS